MKKIGIICEYNPFHNGHLYHLEEIKKMELDSIVILVLGSYFLERGDVSLISKWNKTRIALEYGVNLVIELPVLYGTNSGDYFAYYAVKALNSAGVEKIIFGSETADVDLLKKIAMDQESVDFNETVKKNLDMGSNYPTSLSKTLGITLKSNDLLGVSYIKAIEKINPRIEPVVIRRTNEYNDIESDQEIVSASNIREKLKNGKDIKKYIPTYEMEYINEVDEKKQFEFLKYRIITDDHLENYLGVDEGLENKLRKEVVHVDSVEELIDRVKSKRYTVSRLRRMLVHILLGIEKNDMSAEKKVFRILGFDEVGKRYLKEINSSGLQYKFFDKSNEIERRAALIYYELTKDESIKYEFLNKPIIKESK